VKVACTLALATLALTAAEPIYQVRIGGRTVAVPRERYVAAVVAGEASVLQSDEALKAVAVAARTYAARFRSRHAAEGFDFCSTTHCQRVELDGIAPRLAAATAGELLWYRGKPAFTPYGRDCGGRTEDAGAVWPDLAAPYLRSHPDPYCRRTGASPWQWAADPVEILAALRRAQLRATRTRSHRYRRTDGIGPSAAVAADGRR
jgi:stage II sporulation protein D